MESLLSPDFTNLPFGSYRLAPLLSYHHLITLVKQTFTKHLECAKCAYIRCLRYKTEQNLFSASK